MNTKLPNTIAMAKYFADRIKIEKKIFKPEDLLAKIFEDLLQMVTYYENYLKNKMEN